MFVCLFGCSGGGGLGFCLFVYCLVVLMVLAGGFLFVCLLACLLDCSFVCLVVVVVVGFVNCHGLEVKGQYCNTV